jgi:hypothetical protein
MGDIVPGRHRQRVWEGEELGPLGWVSLRSNRLCVIPESMIFFQRKCVMAGFYDEPEPEPVKPPEKPVRLYYILGGSAAALLIAINVASYYFFRPKIDISKFDKDLLFLTVAENIINDDADHQVIESSNSANRIKVKNIKTGKITSFSLEDLKKSKFAFINSQYEEIKINYEDSHPLSKNEQTQLGIIPKGIVVYPRAPIKTNSHLVTSEGEIGELEQHTTDSIAKVVDVMERELKSAGYSISVSSVFADSGAIVAEHDEMRRIIAVDALPDISSTKILIHYTIKTN